MRDPFDSPTAKAMRAAFQGGKTGAFLSESGKVKRIVYFESGDLVGARSNLASELLGSVMVNRKRITREQLQEAKGFIRSGRKLGQILVELGYLRGGEIESFVRLQIIDVAVKLLEAKPTRLVFSHKIEVEAVTLAPVSIGDVFLEAVNRRSDVSYYRRNLLVDSFRPTQTERALGIASGMRLSDLQAQVLDLVDGERTVSELLGLSPLPEADSLRLLVAFYHVGVLSLQEPPPSEEPKPVAVPAGEPSPSVDPFEKELIAMYNDMQCQNHWEVLGLSRGASHDAVERAHSGVMQRLAADKWAHIPDSDFQEKLSFVRARVKDAFITLSSQSAANVYEKLDEHESQYQESKEKWNEIAPRADAAETSSPQSGDREAQRLFEVAKRAFADRDYWQAIELCRRAIELGEDDDPERYHLLGRALAQNPRWRRDAEQNFRIAHKLEPWDPRYLAALGELYQREGLNERADRVFQQVLTIDPEFRIPAPPEREEKRASRKKAG